MLEKFLKQLGHLTGHTMTKKEFASIIKEALAEDQKPEAKPEVKKTGKE
jgi:hypothetical protein